MKKSFFLLLLVTITSNAQERKFVTTPTIAYNNEKATKAVGIFMRGAMIDSYEMVNGYIYKVHLNYSDPVYITETYNIKDHLRSNDEVSPTPSAIIDEDQYYGSPHLFTNVAGLKVREYPNTNSLVIGTLLNGTVIPIDYYPYDPEAWMEVKIDERTGYIPKKFIGERPSLIDLKQSYKTAKTPEDEKKYAERILELGWNSDRIDNAESLKIFADYAKKNNLTEIAEICLLQAEALKKAPFEEQSFPVEKLIKKKQFGFTLNNEIEPENGFKKWFLEQHLGKIVKSYSDLDDCGLGDYEGNVFFNSAECISHDVNKTYKLRNMEMINSNGFKIKDVLLNGETTEKEFLKSAIGLISSIYVQQNSYYIANDYMAYEFQFKNGKLAKVSAIYYC